MGFGKLSRRVAAGLVVSAGTAVAGDHAYSLGPTPPSTSGVVVSKPLLISPAPAAIPGLSVLPTTPIVSGGTVDQGPTPLGNPAGNPR